MAENYSFMRGFWRTFRPPVHLYLRGKFGYRSEIYTPQGPFLLVSNHVSDWDPVLVASAFRTHMHFVASEHIFRWGFLSRLITALVAPIARQKGGNAAGTVKAMLRRLKDGHNVALFPEGNRTWDGRTADFLPSTGKVARLSGASLITFRLRGAYFANPRWAGGSLRKGRVRGEIVRIYSPEELKAMSPEQINSCIRRDLQVDAWEEQREDPVPYLGKDLAVGLETLLFSCPRCGALHRMKSEGDRFFCTECGASSTLSAEGFLHGDFPYESIADWNRDQQQTIARLCEEATDAPIFTDDDFALRKVQTAQNAELIAEGSAALFRDRLELPGLTLPLADISGMAVMGNRVLFIGTKNGDSYELRTERLRCVVKYLTACTLLGCPTEYGV